MKIGSVLRQHILRDFRNAAVFFGFPGENCIDGAPAGSLDSRLFGEAAGLDIIGDAALRHKVHRNHGKLERGTALKEEYGIFLGNAHEAAQRLLRSRVNFLERR
ncbi:hypothetical protein SDC9_71569 [bioreactor metagenome]|uniref:Uncharacterized protein n=1 Tax=bioreactor metagenome TaxID=1076179 RepID=A0A644Y9U1_9ZZZZ